MKAFHGAPSGSVMQGGGGGLARGHGVARNRWNQHLVAWTLRARRTLHGAHDGAGVDIVGGGGCPPPLHPLPDDDYDYNLPV